MVEQAYVIVVWHALCVSREKRQAMDVIRIKLQDYNIEWDGPIILVKGDMVAILSPFQIIQKIESTAKRIKTRIYNMLDGLQSRGQILYFLELLGQRLIGIKL